MNTTSEKPERNHVYDWLLAVILAFVLGFLLAWWLLRLQPLAKPACLQSPQPAASSVARTAQNGGGGMHGGGAPGKGSPAKFNANGKDSNRVVGNGAPASGGGGAPAGGSGSGSGKVSGGGSYDVSGKTIVNGPSGMGHEGDAPPDSPSAGGGNGDMALPPASGSAGGNLVVNIPPSTGSGKAPGDGSLDASGGDGKTQQGDVEPQPKSEASVTAPAGNGPTTAMPDGKLQLGPPGSDAGPDASKRAGKVVAALDYRYDKSGLPHYPNAVKVASGTDAAAAAAAAGPMGKDYSVTEIVTDDAPDVAAAWYHDHLPPGWNELQMPSAAAMDQMIQQTKTPQPGQSPVDSLINTMIAGPQLEREKPGVDAARAAGLTIFQPADANTDHRMIIVIRDSKTGKTGVLLMKKADTQ